MTRKGTCAESQIEYELVYKDVKKVTLRVLQDGRVRVTAPRSVTVKWLEKWIASNAADICRAQLARRDEERARQERAEVYLLGQRYDCVVCAAQQDAVRVEGQTVIVESTRPGDAAHITGILQSYEDTLCRQVFPEAVRRMFPRLAPYGVGMPKVTPRRMRSRWGSCTPGRGSIRLNTVLIRAPMPCIEYVALHELCHFVHPDHSKDFYAMMTELMPDWRERKAMLEKNQHLLLT